MRSLLVMALLSGAATVAHGQTFSDSLRGPFPILNEGWGNGPIPDDGAMHVDGTWSSPYCQNGIPDGQIAQANTSWMAARKPGAILVETVHANTCDAAEIASDPGWSFNGGQNFPYGKIGLGYGYYQMRMKTSYGDADGVHGTVNSFFIRGAIGNGTNLQNPEIDFEFLTDESWDTRSSGTGEVHLSATGISGDAISRGYPLPFNPSAAFHRYGFAWQKGAVTFYADDKPLATYTLGDLTNPPFGVIIMANNWTGITTWGGIPPRENQSDYYQNVRFYAGATAPPSVVRRPTLEMDPGAMLHGLATGAR